MAWELATRRASPAPLRARTPLWYSPASRPARSSPGGSVSMQRPSTAAARSEAARKAGSSERFTARPGLRSRKRGSSSAWRTTAFSHIR